MVNVFNQSLIQMQIVSREILSVISRQNDEIRSYIVMWGKSKICSCQTGHPFTDTSFGYLLLTSRDRHKDFLHFGGGQA